MRKHLLHSSEEKRRGEQKHEGEAGKKRHANISRAPGTGRAEAITPAISAAARTGRLADRFHSPNSAPEANQPQ
jgi:hypothetical protein